MPAPRQPGDYRLGWSSRLKIARAIGETEHAIGVCDIDVTRVGSRRPEGYPKRLVEAFREDVDLRLSAALTGAEDANSARPAFCDEEIAARRNPDQSRVVETGGQELDDKSWRRFWPNIRRARRYRGTVVSACSRIRWRHVRRSDFAPYPRNVAAPVAISCDTS
jgi:hypothetical protein